MTCQRAAAITTTFCLTTAIADPEPSPGRTELGRGWNVPWLVSTAMLIRQRKTCPKRLAGTERFECSRNTSHVFVLVLTCTRYERSDGGFGLGFSLQPPKSCHREPSLRTVGDINDCRSAHLQRQERRSVRHRGCCAIRSCHPRPTAIVLEWPAGNQRCTA